MFSEYISKGKERVILIKYIYTLSNSTYSCYNDKIIGSNVIIMVFPTPEHLQLYGDILL